jgi:predicted RNase H-like HicB family nuclease
MGKAMNNYVAILEQGPRNWSAYVPDLPGCVAAGATREETERLIQEAIKFHLEGLLLDGMTLPKPSYNAEKRGIAAV